MSDSALLHCGPRQLEMTREEACLERLCHGAEPCREMKIAVVVAHPDDEVIGLGAQLPRWRSARFVQVTNGAPRNMRDALAAGFDALPDYARARRIELTAALTLAGIASTQLHELEFVDQEASLNMTELTGLVLETLRALQPDVVLTHPYEGGHPDHDATAFAVHQAVRQLEQEGAGPPILLEMTSYFNRAGIMATGEFLPRTGSPGKMLVLDEGRRQFKRRLFDCFVTQQKVLAGFPIEIERFRPAPRYDFTRPPHEGRLYYEMFDWGMTGQRWRNLARGALDRLETECGFHAAHC